METDTKTNQCIPDARQTDICQQTEILVPPRDCATSKCSRLIQTTLGCVTCCTWCDDPRWPCISRLTVHRWHWSWKGCCSQLLPWMHPSHPALCWSWWEANSSYVGSGCALSHPWGVPQSLVHWDRATFPQHIPYFPICPVSCDGPWRWLHRLELCLQPPRPLPCYICHNFFYDVGPP